MNTSQEWESRFDEKFPHINNQSYEMPGTHRLHSFYGPEIKSFISSLLAHREQELVERERDIWRHGYLAGQTKENPEVAYGRLLLNQGKDNK